MKYESTRGSKELKISTEAIIKGIAEDKGLYMPVEIPALGVGFDELKEMDYQDIAKVVISRFFDDYTKEEIERMVGGAYDSKFKGELGKYENLPRVSSNVAPMTKAGGAWFLELYHGKTSAFKDMALSILPYLMVEALRKEGEKSKILILAATSGDTGKAALEGFKDVPGTEIIVFYPDGGVSQVQEKQMLTQEGQNTHVYSVKGNFDDCQTAVKRIFASEKVKEALAQKGVKLSSANSINIGRLVPQVAYYVFSYAMLVKNGEIKAGDAINIAVPTGNFGNILAAYLACEMGVPVNKFICASNENKVLTDFINTGIYDKRREFHLTNSPSMDILVSSNLERLLYLLSDRDGEAVSALMQDLDEKGIYEVSEKVKDGLKRFHAGFASEEETLAEIREMFKSEGYLMDTHTAVAYKVYKDYVKETGDVRPTVIASTASAYKFAPAVAEGLGLTENKVRTMVGLKGDKEVTGFEYLRAIAKETGVPVPGPLTDLEEKKVLHGECLEVMDLPKKVLEI